MDPTFGCAVNCIDGRAQIPIIEWVKFHTGVEYVDMITEPGADGALAKNERVQTESISRRLQIAVNAHNPDVIAVCGHYDCVANPVSNDEHHEEIKNSVNIIAGWFPERRIVGLFVNEFGAVDQICDTAQGNREIKSYL